MQVLGYANKCNTRIGLVLKFYIQQKEIKVIKTLGDVGSWLHLWGRSSWPWEEGWCYPLGWARQLGWSSTGTGTCTHCPLATLLFYLQQIHHRRRTLQLTITDGPKCWWLTRFPLQVVGNCTSPVQRGNDKSVLALQERDDGKIQLWTWINRDVLVGVKGLLIVTMFVPHIAWLHPQMSISMTQ